MVPSCRVACFVLDHILKVLSKYIFVGDGIATIKSSVTNCTACMQFHSKKKQSVLVCPMTPKCAVLVSQGTLYFLEYEVEL